MYVYVTYGGFFRGVVALGVLLAAFVPSSASAQNTSGVSGPSVNAGEKAVEYRVGYSLADDGATSAFAHRLHYQQSLDDSWRLRFVVLATDRDGQPFDVRFARIEALWQFVESEARGFDSALNGQLNIPIGDGRPGTVRLGWANSVDLDDRWQARGVFFAGVEYGDNARDGLLLEARAETTYEFDSGLRVGAQLFSKFNTTAHIGGFEEQSHQLGFIVKGKLTNQLSYNAGALFGLSRAASDTDLRLFLTYAL